MPSDAAESRKSHAAMDRNLRILKARKIEALLQTETNLRATKIIDVGTGAGVIAAYFAEQVGSEGMVCSVDVRDERQETSGFKFYLVKDGKLPFLENSFDGAISNHVIEHVGSRSEQWTYLQEINRVTKPNGWLYLATPNRWGPIEPHYRLPLLGGLPKALQSHYVRIAGRGQFYDCRLLDRRELGNLLVAAGWQYSDITFRALRVTAQIESGAKIIRKIAVLPASVLRFLLWFSPTLVFLARKRDGSQP